MALDATLSGEFSNSYCDLDFADTYFENHFNSLKSSQWTALSDDQKESALLEATIIIEQFKFTVPIEVPKVSDLRWDSKAGRFTAYRSPFMVPAKWFYYQYLQFPRNLDIHWSTGGTYIPDQIMRAECEQAIYLINFDESALSNRLQGVTLDKVDIGGKIATTQEYTLSGNMLAPRAHQMIKPYLIYSSRIRRA